MCRFKMNSLNFLIFLSLLQFLNFSIILAQYSVTSSHFRESPIGIKRRLAVQNFSDRRLISGFGSFGKTMGNEYHENPNFPDYPFPTQHVSSKGAGRFNGIQHKNRKAGFTSVSHAVLPPMPPPHHHLPPPPPQYIPYPVPLPVEVELPPAEGIPPIEPDRTDLKTGPDLCKKEIVVTTETDFKCPDAFMLQGSTCVKYDQKPTKRGCKEGWNYLNGVCMGVDVVPVGSKCDPGYEPVDSDTCKKEKRAPKQILCPEGFEMGTEMCVRDVYTKADLMCPEGYQFIGKECLSRQKVPAIPVCLPGFSLVVDHCQREDIKNGNTVCPHGFEHVRDKCEKRMHSEAVPNCPIGYKLENNECIKHNVADVIPICKAGVLEESRCVEHLSAPPSIECPAGFSLIEDTYECSRESHFPAEASCSHGFFDLKNNGCLSKKKTEITYSCPKGYSLVDKVDCVKFEKHSTQTICPVGFSLNPSHNVCIKKEFSDPHLTCPPGFQLMSSGNYCNSTESCPVKMGCHPGFLLNTSRGTCEKVVSEPQKFVCEKGYIQTEDFQCRKIEAIQAEAKCPFGFQLLSIEEVDEIAIEQRQFHQKSDAASVICVGESKTEPDSVCPPGYDLTHSEHGLVCTTVEKMHPKLECSSNFDEVKGKCVKIDIIPMRRVCPAGFKLAAGQCVMPLNEQPVVLCPVGYRLFENVCVKQLNTASEPVCPRSYTFDKLVGKCYKMTVNYDFCNEQPAQMAEAQLPLSDEVPKVPEQILSEEVTTTTTAPPLSPMPQSQFMPTAVPPPPTTVQIVSQPVPIPAPIVYLPQQAMVPPPPPPPPVPVPVPVPVPMKVPVPVQLKQAPQKQTPHTQMRHHHFGQGFNQRSHYY